MEIYGIFWSLIKITLFPSEPYNNGMHPTRITMDAIRKIESLSRCLRAGDAGRYVASPAVP
jgi:hypothetical protein